jgi:hypothetical protein
MDVCIRSRLTSGLAVVGVGALVMAPVVTGQTAHAPTPAALFVVTLTAVTQPLPAPRLLALSTALAPVQQLVPPQPQNPLAQQVGFHIEFVGDFLSTGAVLFAREFATPGALLQDINSGTPAPVAVSRALQTFAQIELEAGRELVGFAAEYVTFQLNFFANLATMPVAAVSAFATSFLAGLPPASATQQSAPQVRVAVTSTDDVATTPKTGIETTARVGDPHTGTSSHKDTDTEQPKKFRSPVVESKSTNSIRAKTRDGDAHPVASDEADGTHKQSNAGTTTSSTTGGAGQADAGSPHEPRHEHHGNTKGGGDKGD